MGDGASDSNSHREQVREEKTAIHDKIQSVMNYTRQFDNINKEIEELENQLTTKKRQRTQIETNMRNMLK